jgi:hypothetical protein
MVKIAGTTRLYRVNMETTYKKYWTLPWAWWMDHFQNIFLWTPTIRKWCLPIRFMNQNFVLRSFRRQFRLSYDKSSAKIPHPWKDNPPPGPCLQLVSSGIWKQNLLLVKWSALPGGRGSIPGRGERNLPLTSVSRPGLGPTQPPIQWVPGVKRGRGVTLTTHPHLVPRSRMSRSYISSPPGAPVACSGTIFFKWSASTTGDLVQIVYDVGSRQIRNIRSWTCWFIGM